MTFKKQGKAKIELDKDKLLLAYFELDKLFNQDMRDEIRDIYNHIEKATGFSLERTLKKVKPIKNDRKK